MYTLVIEHQAAPGKMAELRAAAKERAIASNQTGRAQAIIEELFSANAALVAAIRFESIAGMEADLARNASDPAYQAQVEKIRATLAHPQEPALTENLVIAKPSGPVGNVLTARFFAAPGKAGELSETLRSQAAAGSPSTVGAALSTEVVPAEGVNFTFNLLFADLAGFEAWRSAVRSDGSLAAFGQKISPLVARPVSQRLFRVLVPFPTA